MSRVSFLSFLPLLCCFLSLMNTQATIESRHLLKHINSQHRQKSLGGSLWSNLFLKQVYLAPQNGLMEADKIVALPGQPKVVDFDQYAGYVTVDHSAGRALFYYFVESPQNHTAKPVVLWLNGGPGCSSLGGGAMQELGPFRVNPDRQTLQYNDYSWNQVANVIFLESPAGVGFSYSNTTSDYDKFGDKRTAVDTYTFLVNWLERFAHYKGRDFYITGESYAGHYVPELASIILVNNNNFKGIYINLKGIAMGNAYFDDNTNTKATYEYYWTHALISDESHRAIISQCNFTSGNYSSECIDAKHIADAETGDIDVSDIYAPLCIESSKPGPVNKNDPCSWKYTNSYLNLPELQRALHANVTNLPYPWSMCSLVLGPEWTDSPSTMLPMIKDLIASGIRIWLFSGDQDSMVPVTSTRNTINILDLSIETSWRPWYTEGEVGGYVVEYKGLTFSTVRGTGHMVPSLQPQRALTLISSFLDGTCLPTK